MDPGFAVVVPTFNRLPYLKKCLASLLTLDFSNFEIIAVNDGSTDGTKEFLDNFKNERVRVIHNSQNQGPSQSRNNGIKTVKGEFVAFTDDDCAVDKNWLNELAKSFTDEQTGFVIGQTFYVREGYKGYFPERLVQNIGAKWPMGCNIAYRKRIFEQLGGFDPSFLTNEDTEMAIRAVAGGFAYNRALNAIVYHQAMDWTVKSLLRSASNASMCVLLKKKYPFHYLCFGPPVKCKIFFNIEDYLYLLLAPALIPILLIRYLVHGKRNLNLFFTKWPLLLILRRYYIYKEALRNKTLLL